MDNILTQIKENCELRNLNFHLFLKMVACYLRFSLFVYEVGQTSPFRLAKN